MASRIDICNQAVALLPAQQMASYEENSLEARECRRFYPSIISRMLEGPDDWSFANKRAVLARLGTNGREQEWLYAYAPPADMGTPIRLIPDLASLGIGVPMPLAGEPYAEAWGLYAPLYEQPYLFEGGVIYSNTASAIFEYGVNTIAEASLPAMVVEVVVLELASKLAVPVKKDRKLKIELMQEAEIAWQRAMADDKNRHPQVMPSHRSEALAARAGL